MITRSRKPSKATTAQHFVHDARTLVTGLVMTAAAAMVGMGAAFALQMV